MTLQEKRRNEFLKTMDHLSRIQQKVKGALGQGRIFTFPDQHKIFEGLFLSGWTHWEEFIRHLLVDDLTTDPTGFVLRDVKSFRISGAPRRLAERVLFHPDHPQRYVEWDLARVKSRADDLLSDGHRFSNSLPDEQDLAILKRIRNAIAHKSDRARSSFLRLVAEPPFSLTPNQRRGITVGRFLAAHQWNGEIVLSRTNQLLRGYANSLVPT